MDHNIYRSIARIKQDIESLKVQGATNVAYAVLEGIRIFLLNYKGSVNDLVRAVKDVGGKLSKARKNEPLARNAVNYIVYEIQRSKKEDAVKSAIEACKDFMALIADSKEKIVVFGTEALMNSNIILNHCHSTTVISILKNINELKSRNGKEVKFVVTESRPLYQGRKSAIDLLNSKADVSLIVDDAAASFILDKSKIPVDTVIVGCDELQGDGSFVNKIGTLQLALSSKEAGDKFFVATSLLKLNPDENDNKIKIEERSAREVWDKAPKDLKIFNPAFDHVDSKFVTKYITEAGVLESGEIIESTRKLYPWIFE